MQKNWSKSSRGYQSAPGAGKNGIWGEAEGAGLFSLQERRGKSNCCLPLRAGCYREDGARQSLFPVEMPCFIPGLFKQHPNDNHSPVANLKCSSSVIHRWWTSLRARVSLKHHPISSVLALQFSSWPIKFWFSLDELPCLNHLNFSVLPLLCKSH